VPPIQLREASFSTRAELVPRSARHRPRRCPAWWSLQGRGRALCAQVRPGEPTDREVFLRSGPSWTVEHRCGSGRPFDGLLFDAPLRRSALLGKHPGRLAPFFLRRRSAVTTAPGWTAGKLPGTSHLFPRPPSPISRAHRAPSLSWFGAPPPRAGDFLGLSKRTPPDAIEPPGRSFTGFSFPRPRPRCHTERVRTSLSLFRQQGRAVLPPRRGISPNWVSPVETWVGPSRLRVWSRGRSYPSSNLSRRTGVIDEDYEQAQGHSRWARCSPLRALVVGGIGPPMATSHQGLSPQAPGSSQGSSRSSRALDAKLTFTRTSPGRSPTAYGYLTKNDFPRWGNPYS